MVDDNPINLKLVHVVLSKHGYEVVLKESAQEALKYLEEERPSLILLDIQMPELDGISALKMIRNDPKLKDIPVIALTAYAMKGDREKFLELGFDDYIGKPIEIKNLLNKVEKYIER